MATVFLNYEVIDHLQRIGAGTYKGAHADALKSLEAKGRAGALDLWMSEITPVEMMIGLEKPGLDPDRIPGFIAKDKAKVELAEQLQVRWLSYPCSKFNDAYSRWNSTFRFAGADWQTAASLEQRLETVAGVSVGDARQVASMIYGRDVANLEFRPTLTWFVTEDGDLRRALRREVDAARLPELGTIQIASVTELVAAV